MLKLSANPPALAEGFESVRDIAGEWWVAHTKARAEKALAWDLINHGIPHFLPMLERVTISGGRKRKGLAALFPGYVFFCGAGQARYTAMTTDRICQVIAVRDRDQFVNELSAIERVLASRMTMDFYHHAVVGRRCRVRIGPLQGIEGTIVRSDDVTRLVMGVTMLGRGAALEISADLLEPVE
jgi:transcription antitermination factor NusG